MVTRELLEFLRTQLRKGVSRAQLSQILLAQGGWAQADLKEAYAQIDIEDCPQPVVASPVSPVAVTPLQGSRLSSPEIQQTKISPRSTEVASETLSAGQVAGTGAQPKKEFDVEQLHLLSGEDFLGIFGKKVTREIRPVETQKTIETRSTASTIPAASLSEDHHDFLGMFSAAPLVSPLGTVATPVLQKERTTVPPQPVRVPPIAREVRTSVLPPLAKTPNYAGKDLTEVSRRPSPSSFIPSQSRVLQPSDRSASVERVPSGAPAQSQLSPMPPEKKNYTIPPPTVSAGLSNEIAKVLGGASDQPKTSSRISKIAPPKRTLQDLFAQLQGQAPAPSGTSVLVNETQAAVAVSPVNQAQVIPAVKPNTIFAAQPTNEHGVAKSEKIETDQSKTDRVAFDNAHPKRNALFGVLALIVVTILIGGYYVFSIQKQSPSFPDVGTFFNSLSSLSYTVAVDSDLQFVPSSDGPASTTLVKFALRSQGQALHTNSGFGDGEHKVIFSGGFQTDPMIWSTDIEGTIRVVGTTLYFHADKTPQNGTIDQALLEQNWIKIELDEIAKELALNGTSGSEYSEFLAGDSGNTFTSILARSNPIISRGGGTRKVLPDGSEVYEYVITFEPTIATRFVGELMKAYKGEDVVVSEGERVLLEEAWKKITGTVVVASDGSLRSILVSFSPDNSMYGMKVTGSFSLRLDVNAANTPIAVTSPLNALSLVELKAEMERYQEKTRIAGNDAERASQMELVRSALTKYIETHKRYPSTLKEITSNEAFVSQGASSTIISELVYYGYTEVGKFDKSHRCTTKSVRCDEYHIGIDLVDLENPNLDIDRDVSGEIQGADTEGCTKKLGFACLDQTASLPVLNEVATTTPIGI